MPHSVMFRNLGQIDMVKKTQSFSNSCPIYIYIKPANPCLQ